ncbi:type IVB secretion system protein DotA [Rickettsiella endosymbiont of Dermanyssus gallinae]|uniref:type IVB secretion system protein DotA n=1 Tax=Rickettsiella endosymbiont of Dermanyssus gallinae TaxID=2856608 RepID=UPI001C52DF53|nr:type IVB secretion system protein DotA [Rickettsiella endosymbiont of Dermanyssus gallinae]
MKKILISLFFSLFPSLLLADSLAPPASDLSVSYLATIFGVVDGVLHGTGSQILGTMLGSFNAAILVMASVLLTYALFISILNTAHQGEFLGQKWSSIWVPLRMVSGVGLLLPKATGYSFIQILVMWVVVQGVGAADQVWNVALDYMNRNGTVVEPSQGLGPNKGTGAADNTFLVAKSGDILKSEVCMYTLYNGLVRQYKGKGVAVPDFASSLSVTGKGPNGSNTGKLIDYTKDKGGFISFPGKMDGTFSKYEGACGSVSWDFIGKADKGQVANPANLTANDSASIGVRQMTLDVNSMAKSIADKLAPEDDNQVSKVSLKKGDPLFASNSLVYTSTDYFAIVKPALRTLKGDADAKLKDFIKDAKDTGWILAGSYYYQMAKLNENLRKINDLSVIKDQISPNFKPDYDSSAFQDINNPIILDNLKNNVPNSGGAIDDYIQSETTNAGDATGNHNQLFPSTGGGDASAGGGGLFAKMMGSIFQSAQGFQKKLQDGLNSGSDPILTLSGIGDDLVHTVESVWVGFFAIMTYLVVAGGVAGAAVSFFAPAGPIIGVLGGLFGFIGFFMPVFTFWLMINLSLGATLAYYVPLIPFILFTFGAITWFAIVLESVMAAPLVALGITHPEGHDFLGKAEQAVMLLASVFLRPMLMVFGFIFGIILSYISVSLLNQGFSIALRFMGDLSGDFLALVSQTTLMIIYTGIVLAVVNRSFSMIYEVPNKVMRWIGAQAENTPEEGMLHQIRGNVDSSMRELGQAGSQMAQSELQHKTRDMQAIGKQAQENKNAAKGGATVSGSGG